MAQTLRVLAGHQNDAGDQSRRESVASVPKSRLSSVDYTTSTPMTLLKTYSKQRLAKIFGVNRTTIYSWESHGLPVRQPERVGRPARIDFEEALIWFLNYQDARGVSEKGLDILENVIRERKAKYYG